MTFEESNHIRTMQSLIEGRSVGADQSLEVGLVAPDGFTRWIQMIQVSEKALREMGEATPHPMGGIPIVYVNAAEGIRIWPQPDDIYEFRILKTDRWLSHWRKKGDMDLLNRLRDNSHGAAPSPMAGKYAQTTDVSVDREEAEIVTAQNPHVAWAREQAERAAKIATENWGAPAWEDMSHAGREEIVAQVLTHVAIRGALNSFGATACPITQAESLRK